MKLNNNTNSAIVIIVVFLIFFVGPYFWRKSREVDINSHSKYTFGRVTKKTGSLINGNDWYYEFAYNNKVYESYRPTHINYDVHLGDYFIIQFSSVNPEHSTILYEYRLKLFKPEVINQIWDSIPLHLVESDRK